MPRRPPFKAYLGNLSYDLDERDIEDFFRDLSIAPNGVRIPRDRDTQNPKGFGYIEFNDRDSLLAALGKNGAQFMNRTLKVDLATDRGGGFDGVCMRRRCARALVVYLAIDCSQMDRTARSVCGVRRRRNPAAIETETVTEEALVAAVAALVVAIEATVVSACLAFSQTPRAN